MLRLKPISKDALQAALQKAERYRLINQSWAAESICLDALEVDPDNQEVLITLLLALTDQFPERGSEDVERAKKLLGRLHDEYKRKYYAGIIFERRAKAQLDKGGPASSGIAYHSLKEAMGYYEEAEALRPPGDDEALLRWNTCVRLLQRYPQLQPVPEERPAANFGE
jgi:tetratricopeptide (TPR) repeat protein